MSVKEKNSPICSLLQIAALLANESLEGCASAIALFRRHYGQRSFKVGPRGGCGVGGEGGGVGGDLLPAQIALDVSKSSAVLMGPNGADWAVWESAGVCLHFSSSRRFDVLVHVGFSRNVANAVLCFLTPPPFLPPSFRYRPWSPFQSHRFHDGDGFMDN